jgi:hypothetical protein
MRCHAAVIASAHGQVAWIFRCRCPPRARRAAVCSTRTQCIRLGCGQVAVQGQQFQPGEQDLPGHRGGQPRGVDLEIKGSGPGRSPCRCGWRPRFGVDPVGGVEIGVLLEPAFGVRGPVGDPKLASRHCPGWALHVWRGAGAPALRTADNRQGVAGRAVCQEIARLVELAWSARWTADRAAAAQAAGRPPGRRRGPTR